MITTDKVKQVVDKLSNSSLKRMYEDEFTAFMLSWTEHEFGDDGYLSEGISNTTYNKSVVFKEAVLFKVCSKYPSEILTSDAVEYLNAYIDDKLQDKELVFLQE